MNFLGKENELHIIKKIKKKTTIIVVFYNKNNMHVGINYSVYNIVIFVFNISICSGDHILSLMSSWIHRPIFSTANNWTV